MFGPVPEFTVGHGWESKVPELTWSAVTVRAKKVSRKTGTSAGFLEALDEARRLLEAGDLESLEQAFRRRRICRAAASLWLDDAGLAERTLRQDVLSRLIGTPDKKLSRLTALALVSVHLRYFDLLDDWAPGLFEAMRATISAAVSRQRPLAFGRDVIESARQFPGFFLERLGPQRVADRLLDHQETLESFLADNGLLGFEGGRFGELVRHWLFLRQVQAADPSENHAFLSEIVAPSVAKAPARDGKYFGHSLLEALTDKDRQPGQAWIDAILEIAGDPRLTHVPRWFEWWHAVSDRALRQMVSWLSAEDLRLFLIAVEEYGKYARDEDLQRMFPDRKLFLEGLHAQGLIRETRLILGSDARGFVKQRLGSALKSDVATLEKDRSKSIILVDCGDFHLVEGSHVFKLWIYRGRPVDALIDRRRRSFTPEFLRKDVPHLYEGGDLSKRNGYIAIPHMSQRGGWQFKALDFIARLGVELPADEMMTEKTYYDMRRLHGLPTKRR